MASGRAHAGPEDRPRGPPRPRALRPRARHLRPPALRRRRRRRAALGRVAPGGGRRELARRRRRLVGRAAPSRPGHRGAARGSAPARRRDRGARRREVQGRLPCGEGRHPREPGARALGGGDGAAHRHDPLGPPGHADARRDPDGRRPRRHGLRVPPAGHRGDRRRDRRLDPRRGGDAGRPSRRRWSSSPRTTRPAPPSRPATRSASR